MTRGRRGSRARSRCIGSRGPSPPSRADERSTAWFPVRAVSPSCDVGTGAGPAADTDTEPGTLLYVSWRSKTRAYEFLHFMSFVDAGAEPAPALSNPVRAFTEGPYPLCGGPPALEEWQHLRERRTKESR